jgi:hypothetical protein
MPWVRKWVPWIKQKKAAFLLPFGGRGDWIRTSDSLLPKQVRYQAALRPELPVFLHLAAGYCQLDFL